MKVVIHYNNGMEAKTLTEKQVELLRRSVAGLYEEEKEFADMTEPLSNLVEAEAELEEIEAIEQLRDLLTTSEVYEKAKEA